MPFERFIWSLIAPMGFRNMSFANEAAFDTAINVGQIQDPRGGLMFMHYPTGTAKPPIEIVVTHTPPSLTFGFAIRMKHNGGAVTGFTRATYFFEDGLVPADADGTITREFLRGGQTIVRVILNDGRSASVVIDSTASAVFSAPVNTVLPVISGAAQVGATILCSQGTWTGNPTPTFGYQWYKDDVVIPGSTLNSYIVVTPDIGAVIHCIVTGTNTQGSTPAASLGTAAVIPVLQSWAELVATLVDDEADVAAFLTMQKITPPAKWAGWSFARKIEWLEANKPTNAGK